MGNDSTHDLIGAEIGFVNVSDAMRGVQAGAFNVAKEVRGLQIGVVNEASMLRGVQIGLVNHAEHGGVVEWSALVNIGFGENAPAPMEEARGEATAQRP